MKVKVNEKILNLEIANSFFKRLKGLMFKKEINYCLQLKTKSIHTFFMKVPIDVLMTDKNNLIVAYFKNVPKNKILFSKNAYYTYEFPPNFLFNIQIGDQVKISK